MSAVTIDQAMQMAVQHHQGGRLAEAEAIYRQILVVNPQHADALHRLGWVAHQVGRHDIGADLIGKAIQAKPDYAEAHNNLGIILKRQGQLERAIRSYRVAIKIKPDFAEAHSNLGNALKDQGKLDQAIASYHTAIQLRPDFADAHNNLGTALNDKGQFEQAIAAHRTAIQLNPVHAEAYSSLGNTLWSGGQIEEAIAACRTAIQLRPDLAEAHNNLGNALRDQGKVDQAITSYRVAVQLKPGLSEFHNNLGIALGSSGQLDQAIAALRAAIQLKPGCASAYNNLSIALKEQGWLDQAIVASRTAVQLKPDYAEAHFNLANAFKAKGKIDQAAASYHTAIRLRPNYVLAHMNLGSAFLDQGQIDQALASYRRALAINPDSAGAHSDIIFLSHYDPGQNAAAVLEEAKRWDKRHAEPLRDCIKAHPNPRDPERRLRVGYVSADFRDHPVGRFMLPLLAAHDHRSFEVFAYVHTSVSDQLTQQLKTHTHHWRNLVGLSEERAAELIRQDGIDILVDLGSHTAHYGLLIFARKPAPVQVTYLAYPGTTGMATMGYRLTDPYLDPPGVHDDLYSECSFRLPETYWCYAPICPDISVNPLPAMRERATGVVFGCLNNFCKVTAPTLALWCRLLEAVPGSRLLLHAHEGSHRQRTHGILTKAGIDPRRLSFVGKQPLADYLRQYNDVDIALDPFPFAGGTTTCDALWMGVPVVSLCGEAGVSRGGFSLLSNLGLPELVAHSEAEYLQIAVDLANDLPRLAELRATLRQRMEASALMDAPRFVRNIEAAFREMWTRWCANPRT